MRERERDLEMEAVLPVRARVPSCSMQIPLTESVLLSRLWSNATVTLGHQSVGAIGCC